MNIMQIPLSSMRPHIEGAVRQGVSLDTLLAQSFIERQHGDYRDLISPAQRLLLCINSVLTVEDATHGLARTSMRATYPAIGLMMALGCSTLEGALMALGRLYASESDAVCVQLRTEQESAILSVHMQAKDDRDIAYIEENFLIFLFMQCLRFLGRAPPVSEVTLRDPYHFNLGRRHWGFQGSVKYGEVTAFRFPRKLLAEPPASRAGDDVMWECHRLWLDYVDGKLSMATPTDFVSGGGFVRFADMVRDSGRSPNTLRRQLQASNQGFRDARQRALVLAASIRLSEGGDTVETIAAELGYRDTKSFRRFLKNATGLTPQQIREQRLVHDSPGDSQARLQIKAIGGRMNV